MADIKFKAKSKSENKTKTVVQTKGFTMIIDEPKALGGTNDGANPLEYLLAALSGCLSVVSHIVAKELGFELKGLEIELEGDLNPAKYLGMSDAERTGFKEVRVSIKPDSTADAATLEKWVKIVESRCPVSDNITNATPVKITLA
jgi:uncharacterized OsmC-like protein